MFFSRAIIEIVRCDCNSKLDNKENPFAPLLTQTQKVLLGLLLKLQNRMENLLPIFTVESEKSMLQEKSVERIVPLTRLYLAVCKMKEDVRRIRKMCLDALYFMGDLVVPFLYTVLTSWAEVLPRQSECGGKERLQLIFVSLILFCRFNFTKGDSSSN